MTSTQNALRAALAGVYTTRRRWTTTAELLKMSRELASLPAGRLIPCEQRQVASMVSKLEKDWSLNRREELRLKSLWGREFRP